MKLYAVIKSFEWEGDCADSLKLFPYTPAGLIAAEKLQCSYNKGGYCYGSLFEIDVEEV